MSTGFNVEAVSFFAKIDGKICLIPIAAESAQTCVAMLSVFQYGTPSQTRAIVLPDHVSEHVRKAGEAIGDVINKKG